MYIWPAMSLTDPPATHAGKQEDWKCPNTDCGANVFGSKSQCFKCHTKKDGSKGEKGEESFHFLADCDRSAVSTAALKSSRR